MEKIIGHLRDFKVTVWLTGAIDVETKEQIVNVNTHIEHYDGRSDHGKFKLNLQHPFPR
jgi:hypothetical protein